MSPWPFFWKTSLVSLFPEALQLCKERSVLGRAAILTGQAPARLLSRSARCGHSPPMVLLCFVRSHSGSVVETQQGEERESKGQRRGGSPRASPSVCAELKSPQLRCLMQNTCRKSLFYIISPFPSGGRPAQAPETSLPALAPGSCHCSILSGSSIMLQLLWGWGRGGEDAETRLVGGRSSQKALQNGEG